MPSRHTFVTAFLGAIVGVVLSFLPFSTAIGGAVAGFLESPDGREGVLVGALAGLFMFVPIGLLAVALFFLLGFGFGFAGLPLEGVFLLVLVLGFVVSIVLVYTVGLGAIGGYLGSYLARRYPERRTRTREAMRMRPTEPERRPRANERSEPTRWHESHDEPGAGRHDPDLSESGAESDRPEVKLDRTESAEESDDDLESAESADDDGLESRENADDDRPGE